MALTAKRVVSFEGDPERRPAVEAAGNDTYYLGAILIADANGYAAVPTDAAGLYILGIFDGRAEGGYQDYEMAVPNNDHRKLGLLGGLVWLPLDGGSAQSDVGELAYVKDDASLTQSAGSKTVAYLILAVDDAADLVCIDTRAPIKVA
jgi:hypothetical protein